jgi:hypothetical protein
VSMFAEFRESRLFKLVSDISVFHWFFTVVPGGIAAVGARLHGKPVEIVLLFFFGVCAFAFMALHYGALAWTKYVSHVEKQVEAKIPGNLQRLLIPIAALLIVITFSVWPKHTPTTDIHQQSDPTPQGVLTTAPNNPASQSVRVQSPALEMQNVKTVQHSSTHKPKKVVTEAEAESRVVKMADEYKLKHGECPTVEFVNEWLHAQKVPFHVASMRCEVNRPGSFTFLNDEGKVNEASIGKLTVDGSPAPNTNTTLFHVAPGGELGKLTVNEAHIHNWLPEEPVPAPPPDAPRDNFHSRIKDLNKEMWDWKRGLEAASPSVTDSQYYQYWSARMAEFHTIFGDRLILLAKQLRKCGRTQVIYDRERNKVDSSAMVELDITDLWTIDGDLPQDEKQLQCANE